MAQVRGGARPLAPRIDELSLHLDGVDPRAQKSAVAELAMLSSASETARRTIVKKNVERKLIGLLAAEREPQVQCWLMSILSNLASGTTSDVASVKTRQSAVVPVLCSLVTSSSADVQHLAALHLATLSHSEPLSLVISKSGALAHLRSLEQKQALRVNAMQQEASQYARWTLRTAAGRNYKPAFQPKTKFELAQEELELRAQLAAATHMQARVRGHQAQVEYVQEREARTGAATTVQACYRGHLPRNALRKQANASREGVCREYQDGSQEYRERSIAADHQVHAVLDNSPIAATVEVATMVEVDATMQVAAVEGINEPSPKIANPKQELRCGRAGADEHDTLKLDLGIRLTDGGASCRLRCTLRCGLQVVIFPCRFACRWAHKAR